jgi:hypothetical protein
MWETQKRNDDFVIYNRTGPDVRGGLVEVWELTRPGITPQEVVRFALVEIKAVGIEHAQARRVSLWYDTNPIGMAERLELVAAFRVESSQ